MTRDDLEHVWTWANDKLATGEQPPWVWDQYVKLCEILDAIRAGMAETAPLHSRRSVERRARHLRLVADNARVGNAARHFESDI